MTCRSSHHEVEATVAHVDAGTWERSPSIHVRFLCCGLECDIHRWESMVMPEPGTLVRLLYRDNAYGSAFVAYPHDRGLSACLAARSA